MVEQKERHTWRVREKQNRDREIERGEREDERQRGRERDSTAYNATQFYKVKPVKFASNALTLVPHFT